VTTDGNLAAVRAAYEAFSSGDLDRFIALLADDFRSRQSDAVPWRGTYRGHQGVREMFGRVAEHAAATYEPDEFIDGGDTIVVVGSARITPRTVGQSFDVRELHVWSVDGGQLRALDVFLNAPAPLLATLDPAARTAGPLAGRYVSTGELPGADVVRALVVEAHERFGTVDDGAVADYIPALADTPPDLFGACVANTRGAVFSVGDAGYGFSIQSVSKPFVFALVCDAIGHETARDRLGVNSTGLPFNSVMAIELSTDRTMNPMVNAGAIATTSLVPGATAEDKWQFIHEGLSHFAGRNLELDEEVYESEAASNLRNQGIAHLLDSYGRLYFDPDESTDLYTRQCSLVVTAEDLAMMGATLADDGVNPRTGTRVIAARHCERVLAVMSTAGLYERSGEWMYDIGLPGKSGVSGGIVTVSPGKGGLGTFSPRLDAAGNSVRGQLLTRHLSEALGLNIFTSAPAVDER
jgi:glutaminase